MSVADDIQTIDEQERLLVFKRFGDEEAWALGCRLRELALLTRKPVLIEIEAAGRLFFCSAIGETTPGRLVQTAPGPTVGELCSVPNGQTTLWP